MEIRGQCEIVDNTRFCCIMKHFAVRITSIIPTSSRQLPCGSPQLQHLLLLYLDVYRTALYQCNEIQGSDIPEPAVTA